jgi:FkbM family methyltransferase
MFVYIRLSEDKRIIFYKNVADKAIDIRLEGYDCYSDRMLFVNELTCEPNVEYYTYFANSFKNRKLLIIDRHTNEILAPFVLDGTDDLNKMDHKNYIHNLLGFVAQDHEIPGIEFVINEHAFIHEYQNIVDVEVGDVVVDVGFNYGLYSLMALKKGAKEIWGFEPNLRIYSNLKKYFPDQDRVHIFNFAVWDRNSLMTFYDDIGHLGSGIYETLPKESILDSYEVRTINLYDFLIYHNVLHIDLLKIDCEGTEYDIIECIPSEYLKNVKKIHIEYHMNGDGVKLQKMLDKLTECSFEINFGHNYSITSWIGMIYCKQKSNLL